MQTNPKKIRQESYETNGRREQIDEAELGESAQRDQIANASVLLFRLFTRKIVISL
jgi:hypothetical protein